MNVSFAWTTPAYVDGSKTVTRRFWKDHYAAKFHAGDTHMGIEKHRVPGGVKKLGIFMVVRDPYKEKLKYMTDEHFVREGGTRFWKDKAEFIEMMGGPEAEPYVLEFLHPATLCVCGAIVTTMSQVIDHAKCYGIETGT